MVLCRVSAPLVDESCLLDDALACAEDEVVIVYPLGVVDVFDTDEGCDFVVCVDVEKVLDGSSFVGA